MPIENNMDIVLMLLVFFMLPSVVMLFIRSSITTRSMASSVFSTQLMTPHANSSQNLPLPDDLARLKLDQVQVVTKEPRVSSIQVIIRLASIIFLRLCYINWS